MGADAHEAGPAAVGLRNAGPLMLMMLPAAVGLRNHDAGPQNVALRCFERRSCADAHDGVQAAAGLRMAGQLMLTMLALQVLL